MLEGCDIDYQVKKQELIKEQIFLNQFMGKSCPDGEDHTKEESYGPKACK